MWKMSSWSRSRQNPTSTYTSNKTVLKARASTSPQGRRVQLQGRSHSVHSPHTDSRWGNMPRRNPSVSDQQPTWCEHFELDVDKHSGRAAPTATSLDASPDRGGIGPPRGRVIVCV